MDDGCLDMTKAFHVGCRGSVIGEDVLVEDKQQGWTTIDLDMFVDIGPVEAARRVREQIGDTPTIVSVDMDVLEPGECPGVSFTEAGGMTCRELFRFLRALKGLNVIGGEVSQTVLPAPAMTCLCRCASSPPSTTSQTSPPRWPPRPATRSCVSLSTTSSGGMSRSSIVNRILRYF